MDYAFKSTAMIYKFGDLEDAASAIRNADYRLVPDMQNYLRTVIGTREDNMQKLVDFLGTLK